MTYLNLDADRLLGIVDGLNRIVASSLDVDEVTDVVARVARVVAGADGASLEIDTPDMQRMVTTGDMDGAGSTTSVTLEHGVKLGTLMVGKAGTDQFDSSDIEALRLLAVGAAAHLTNAIQFSNVEFESRVDQLTGLGNRLAFEERLGWELARASRYEEPISLVVFDIDDFGRMNDRFGHEEGDKILQAVAGVLQGRAADSCFRLGPDEFGVIMPSTGKEGAEIAAIRMTWAVANLREDEMAVTVSAGVTQADIPDPRAFFASAESALRSAKASANTPAAMSA